MTILLALAPSAWLAWEWRDGAHLGIYHDDGLYYVTAKSLAEGGGHRIASLPEAPAQTKYPPVWPLVLSGVWRLNPEFPGNLPLAMLVCWLVLPAMLAVVWLWYSEIGLDRRMMVVLVVWLAVNPVVVFFALMPMSELLFTTLLMGAIVAAERATTRGRSVAWAAAAGLLAALTVLTRSSGLPLLGTVPLILFWHRRWRSAAVFVGTMVPLIGLWFVWKAGNPVETKDLTVMYYRNYLAYHLANTVLSDLPSIVLRNFVSLIEAIGEIVLYTCGVVNRNAIFLRVLAFVAMSGMVRLTLRTRAWHLAAFSVAYLMILLQWHGPPDDRFLVTLAPFILAGFATELLHLWDQVRKVWKTGARGQRVAAGAIVAVVLVAGPLLVVRGIGAGLSHYIPSVLATQKSVLIASKATYEWIRNNTPPTARFIACDDPLLYLYTGRQAVRLNLPHKLGRDHDMEGVTRTLNSIPELANDMGVRYGVFTPYDYRILSGEVFETCSRWLRRQAFHPVFSDGGVIVCELDQWIPDGVDTD